MEYIKEYNDMLTESSRPSKDFASAMKKDKARKARLERMAHSWMKRTGKSQEEAEKEFDVKLTEVKVGDSDRSSFYVRGKNIGEDIATEIERLALRKVGDDESDEFRDLVFQYEQDFLEGLSQMLINPISIHNIQ